VTNIKAPIIERSTYTNCNKADYVNMIYRLHKDLQEETIMVPIS